MPAENQASFFDLPAEIRLAIYELAFTGLKIDRRLPEERFGWKHIDEPVGILLSNKQIYYEAAPMFYRMATFWATYGTDRWADWFVKLPLRYRNLIAKIELRDQAVFLADETLDDHIQDLRDKGIRIKPGVVWITIRSSDTDQDIWMNELGQQRKKWSSDGVFERTELHPEEFELMLRESEVII